MSDKILKEDPTKTVTEKGAFNPKTDITKEKAKNLKAFNLNKTIAKTALKATKFGAIGTAAAMVGKKAYDIFSEMKKEKVDFPKDPVGPEDKNLPSQLIGTSGHEKLKKNLALSRKSTGGMTIGKGKDYIKDLI